MRVRKFKCQTRGTSSLLFAMEAAACLPACLPACWAEAAAPEGPETLGSPYAPLLAQKMHTLCCWKYTNENNNGEKVRKKKQKNWPRKSPKLPKCKIAFGSPGNSKLSTFTTILFLI